MQSEAVPRGPSLAAGFSASAGDLNYAEACLQGVVELWIELHLGISI